MEREYRDFLRLMGAFVREEPPRLGADTNWERLAELSRVHSLIGVWGYMLTNYHLCPEMAEGARHLCISTIAGFSQRNALAEQFSRDLAEQGIDHILMKGYVVKDCYCVPELRTYGDIDLAIRPEDRQRCHHFLLSRGFQVKTDWEPVYSYIRGQEFYELHTRLLDTDIPGKPRLEQWFANPWENAIPMGNHCWKFSTEYHFLYLLAHLAKHISGSGAGVRMYMDIALYVRRFGEDMDWDWVTRSLEETGLASFGNTVLSFVDRYFGVNSPLGRGVSREILEELAVFTISGGIFGREGRDSGTLTLKGEKPDATPAGTVLRRLFPPAKTIENRYTYLQKCPWLLPGAWIHRLVKTRKSWRDHTREARNILTADEETVHTLRQILSKIGL